MDDQIVTPWKVSCDKEKGVDYERIITKFGCQPITNELINQLEEKTRVPVHRFIKRGLVFAHRDFDKILDKKPYLYTGRGPSSDSMHLGHAIPFIFTKYLQEAFDAPLVIQITDDEKYLFSDKSLNETINFGRNNMKDIIAFGFSDKTFMFSNFEYSSKFEENTLKIAKSISLNEAQKVFGFGLNNNIGQIFFPAKEIAPSFPSSFPFLKDYNYCLIPAAIDQDPYFRLARDKAVIYGENKPCTIYSKFLPSLRGVGHKMSASDPLSSIYLTDGQEDIKLKITKHAFSGGQFSLKEQRKKGANTEIDISYIYLSYLMEDDVSLLKIKKAYSGGEMITSEIKAICISEVQKFVLDYQIKRSDVDDETLKKFTKEF